MKVSRVPAELTRQGVFNDQEGHDATNAEGRGHGRGELFVVDYDIPLEPHAKRRAFYRALRRILRKHEIQADRSTQSVWILNNQQLAEQIHYLAQSYGQSHLYVTTKTDDNICHA